MSFLSQKYETLNDLWFAQLDDIYDAERRLAAVLPKMARAAFSSVLRFEFNKYLDETKNQMRRLEEVYAKLDRSPGRYTCKGMKGLVEEGEEIVGAKGDETVRDAGLIAAAQKIQHYQIASYGTICCLARLLGFEDAATILDQALKEEKDADMKLTQVAKTEINVMAKH
jgi:ferritin-like metal-binding protein YciE